MWFTLMILFLVLVVVLVVAGVRKAKGKDFRG